MQFILCQCNGFSGPLLDSLHSWYPPWRHQHQQPVYPLSVCIMSALGTFHPPRVSSTRSPHTEDWSEARVCSGLVTYSDIQPVSAVSGSHSRVVTRLMRVVSMYVLNCSASTTIFTVNGSHRNTSYSDAGLKGIFSTHATINKHVDVATCCCCRLLKCNYNFCAQPPLGEVQCMCTTMQCIGKFLQLTEGWDIQLWYKPATVWRKSLTSLLFCYHLDTVSKIKTITIHNKTRLFEDKKRN